MKTNTFLQIVCLPEEADPRKMINLGSEFGLLVEYVEMSKKKYTKKFSNLKENH